MHFQLRSGRLVDPFALQTEDIDLGDIAHSLANICRYNGHVLRRVSVAQHSLLVLDLVRDHVFMRVHDFGDASPQLQLAALFHDAHEAYVTDLPSPLKCRVPGWRAIEEQVQAVVEAALGIPAPSASDQQRVKLADQLALGVERRLFLARSSDESYWAGVPTPNENHLELGRMWGAWNTEEIVAEFCRTAEALLREVAC